LDKNKVTPVKEKFLIYRYNISAVITNDVLAEWVQEFTFLAARGSNHIS